MSMITAQQVDLAKAGTYLSGDVWLLGISKSPTKNGGSFLKGFLSAKGSIPFKVWSGTDAYDTLDVGDANVSQVCKSWHIRAKVDEYGGSKSLILESVSEPQESFDFSDYSTLRYDTEKYMGSLSALLERKLSREFYSVWKIILEGVEDRFKKEFASSSHHDNYPGGLMAHTTNVVKLSTFIETYPSIKRHCGEGLLFLGVAIHDIGKVFEYINGVMSSDGLKLSHHTLGVLYLESLKGKIEEVAPAFVEDGYYNELLAVIEQHHGQYEETPRTIIAYLVHLFDKLESCLQSLDQKLESTEAGNQVIADGFKLI